MRHQIQRSEEGQAIPAAPAKTPSILSKTHQILLNDIPLAFDNIMLWAASLLCFFGFLRSGEITTPTLTSYDPSALLSYNDISVDNPVNPTIVKVRLKCSKTDPFRHGVEVHVGKTGQALCPVVALLNYGLFAERRKAYYSILVMVSR